MSLCFFFLFCRLFQFILTPEKIESGGLKRCAGQLQTRGSWSASRLRWLRSVARCLMWRVKWWRPGALESPGPAHQGATAWRRYPVTTLIQSCQLVARSASWTCWGDQLRLVPGPAALVSTATLLIMFSCCTASESQCFCEKCTQTESSVAPFREPPSMLWSLFFEWGP